MGHYIDLPIVDDNFDGKGSEGSHSQNQKEDEEESKSSIRVHDSYDDNTSEQTPNVTTVPVTISRSDDEFECEEQPLVRRMRSMDLITSAVLMVGLSCGKGSSDRIMKRSRSLDLGAF